MSSAFFQCNLPLSSGLWWQFINSCFRFNFYSSIFCSSDCYNTRNCVLCVGSSGLPVRHQKRLYFSKKPSFLPLHQFYPLIQTLTEHSGMTGWPNRCRLFLRRLKLGSFLSFGSFKFLLWSDLIYLIHLVYNNCSNSSQLVLLIILFDQDLHTAVYPKFRHKNRNMQHIH